MEAGITEGNNWICWKEEEERGETSNGKWKYKGDYGLERGIRPV